MRVASGMATQMRDDAATRGRGDTATRWAGDLCTFARDCAAAGIAMEIGRTKRSYLGYLESVGYGSSSARSLKSNPLQLPENNRRPHPSHPIRAEPRATVMSGKE